MLVNRYSCRSGRVKATYHIKFAGRQVVVRATHLEMLAMLGLVAAYGAAA